jgi:hypothetical protein
MKNIIITILLLMPAVILWAQAPGQLTTEEKTEISQHLTQSWDHLEHLVKDLSQEQWHHKAVDSVWSIAEIAEHLEKSEQQLFGLVKDQLTSAPAQPDKAVEASAKTQKVMEAITSRDHKVKTRPDLEPTGDFNSPKDFLKSFEKLRKESISYAKSTEDALRHHFVSFGPLGELDGYQILMFMSGHLERHIQQIEEVMQDPTYPSI